MHKINTALSPNVIGPYSQGIRISNFIFTSAQLPINPNDGLMPSDIINQTTQALYNIKYIVEEGNSHLNKIIKITIFLKNLDDMNDVNTTYKKFFDQNNVIIYPARSCIEVQRLPKNSSIQIEAIAII
uniref:RidA family protein n=1 Tax=Candidatus Aschnera chinzeii TaxID=1485666 RepID=A0AAT9G4A3_9ENTR|nr:MAG: RidA family protein [Candidatus Aschnera chinzeii]